MAGTVISLSDVTGNMVRPWNEAGYDCWIIDLQHPRGKKRGRDGITRVGADIHELHRDHWWMPPEACFVIMQPDCTYLTNSGNRWQELRGPGAVARGLLLADAHWRIAMSYRCEWLLENPAVGRLATSWRKPDHTFHPWEYSGYLRADDPTVLAANDAYSKLTGIWCSRGFVMPPKRPWEGLVTDAVFRCPKSDDRADLRSVTPMGFARAVFEANAAKRPVARAV